MADQLRRVCQGRSIRIWHPRSPSAPSLTQLLPRWIAITDDAEQVKESPRFWRKRRPSLLQNCNSLYGELKQNQCWQRNHPSLSACSALKRHATLLCRLPIERGQADSSWRGAILTSAAQLRASHLHTRHVHERMRGVSIYAINDTNTLEGLRYSTLVASLNVSS